MAEQIYHLNEQRQLAPMGEEPFELEDNLQELVAEYPRLLSGEQMNPDSPRRFILVGREQGIADIIGGSNRWSLDHLLIDQDAIPTLVEAKRSSNSQIRREIVGQMMDYAAHATQTWNVSNIRRVFEERLEAAGQDPDSLLAQLLQTESEPDADAFWQQVETNLRAARLRLLFVADGIPDELTRVVEFLNEQMPGIEVLAVEIKQFKGGTGTTLVPRVIGRTSEAAAASRRSRTSGIYRQFRRQLEERLIAAGLLETHGPDHGNSWLAINHREGIHYSVDFRTKIYFSFQLEHRSTGRGVEWCHSAFDRLWEDRAYIEEKLEANLEWGRDWQRGRGSHIVKNYSGTLRQLDGSWDDVLDIIVADYRRFLDVFEPYREELLRLPG